ncbi:response regulator transcription factor [Actinoplanes sp. LDG1-06]|uniref:Response regulator transcription factor n=1 Tax=Paractinoplanes ovalisporus TaxID=2810368 RepID=A0ABS2AV31_9ACTN|nr:response regulator transcription factor [Actinoplanes ovalisporus]MBM2623583.1 response regulator transcription factor [Actinoplanes ovalisporus]
MSFAGMTQLAYEPAVLVVAPDPGLRGELSAELSGGGYQVTARPTGTAALRVLGERVVDLIVVDRDTPDLVRLGRRQAVFPARPPVLCVTACEFLGELVPVLGTRVEDYVTKPWHGAELLARAQVLLRHRGATAPASTLRHGDLLLDDVVRQAWRGERALDVTPTEYRLLRYLLLNAGRVLSKEQLADHVWGEDREDGTTERLVSRLRRKVDRTDPRLIHTHRGFGYRLGMGR